MQIHIAQQIIDRCHNAQKNVLNIAKTDIDACRTLIKNNWH